MDHNDKEIRRALILCVPYLLVIFFLDDLDKLFYAVHSHLGNPFLVLYMFIATVIILIYLMHSIFDFRDHYETNGYKASVPFIIYVIALLNSFWSPLRISSDLFKSKNIYSAYRKDHYGHVILKMKANKSFTIRYPGPLGMADWEYGKWNMTGDTFYLDYDRGRDTSDIKPDTLIRAADGLMKPIGVPDDTIELYKNQLFRMSSAKRKQ